MTVTLPVRQLTGKKERQEDVLVLQLTQEGRICCPNHQEKEMPMCLLLCGLSLLSSAALSSTHLHPEEATPVPAACGGTSSPQ